MKTVLCIGSLVAVSVVSLALTGCGDKCQRMMNKAKECVPGLKDSKPDEVEKQLTQCRAELQDPAKKEDTEAQVACMEKGTCADVLACVSEVSKKSYQKKQLATVNSATAAGKFDGDALSTCKYSDMKDNKDLEGACKAFMDKAIVVKFADLTAKRDKGVDASSDCYDLKSMAEKAGGDQVKKADTLCKEVGVTKNVADTLAEVKKNIDAKKAELPFNCDYYIGEAEKIGSDWANKQVTSMAKACYADLGQIILEAKVPTMEYVCDYNVEKVYNALKKYKLENDKNKPLVAKADKLCEKK
jgi:hypothetical protein